MWSLGLAVELFLNKELSPICVILISLQGNLTQNAVQSKSNYKVS